MKTGLDTELCRRLTCYSIQKLDPFVLNLFTLQIMDLNEDLLQIETCWLFYLSHHDSTQAFFFILSPLIYSF